MNQIQIITLIIFGITYIGIIFTRLPWINIDRPSAAFFGAVAMILFGVISFEEAMFAIDFNTITLLLGTMIIITTLKLDGFFSLIAHKTMAFAKNQFRLLVIITFVTGISSAFMVNDAVVLLFTPVIIMICSSYKINPLPFLIAEILASNAGSVMTITGNPQNMIIGMNSQIPYGLFLLHLLPVAFLSMSVIVFVVRMLYPANFSNKTPLKISGDKFDYNFKSMRVSVPIFFTVLILFFTGHYLNISIPMIALIGGSLILIFGKIKPSKIIKEVDWVLLLFFVSLFIVVKAVENAGLMAYLVSSNPLADNMSGVLTLHGISFVASQIVSNVPFTIAILPLMKSIHSDVLWLALASASTLAGNATIIGAMANLIVIESAKNYNIKIKFFEFFKAGIITTLLTFIISLGVLWTEMLLGVL
ncbi:MAG: SLC13 family permease [Bacteroidales bacterium]|jgi:Na+/H+ antiporter NhaD/arsenite permease-like protein|nr:SLC13 family permease [Bacteroidales bacterium]MDD4214226.1 SLC13 family permease [Bacteroidales bacterium]